VAARLSLACRGSSRPALRLVDLLSTHPQATYFMRVRGDSMIGVGIYDNDIVVVNRALQAKHGSIVVARPLCGQR
jgi:DNA polymerase V